MARFVMLRDQTCTAPGCSKPAVWCDLDHGVPWPVGATHPDNLDPKCEGHHRVRHAPGWTVERDPPGTPRGTTRWISPTGHAYDRERPAVGATGGRDGPKVPPAGNRYDGPPPF